jgi:type I restriction enzyme M protein
MKSHIVTLEEIKKNDFNLNIPRYISNCAPEEIIDLDQTLNELIECNRDIKKATEQINVFLRELGMKEIE